MSSAVEFHRRACTGFSGVAAQLGDEQWSRPTPCTDWDARALVEHVIGFHEVLLLRPLGVRAHRPKTGPAERWEATSAAMFAALHEPVAVLGALTTDVLVHTWDLARAANVQAALDTELCDLALDGLPDTALPAEMFAAAVPVRDDVDSVTKLIARYGRDPSWQPPASGSRA